MTIKAGVEMVSNKFGIIKMDTHPSEQQTNFFISILKPYIQTNAICEILHQASAPIFHYGLRWGRIVPENPHILSVFETDPVEISSCKKDKYAYSKLDPYRHKVKPLSELKPIIALIEASLGIDMSHYDCVIGNIYLKGLYIPPHADTTESETASEYPVIVYTLGNGSALGIWDDSTEKKIQFQYDCDLISNHKGPNNEILTQNGTIYAFGIAGKGRFDMIHATPVNNNPCLYFSEIELPNHRFVRKELRGLKTKNYTITLTFRRAQDVESGMPKSPKSLNLEKAVESSR